MIAEQNAASIARHLNRSQAIHNQVQPQLHQPLAPGENIFSAIWEAATLHKFD
jgi:hypothetical protein